MKTEIRYLGALFALFVSANAIAETKTVERWSIDQIVARAMEKTPEINALLKDVEVAENLARQAGKWENPDLGIAAGPMTLGGSSGRSVDVSVKQSVPIFGQKAIAEKVGEQNKLTVEIASQKQILLLKTEVVKLAVRFAALEEQAKHTLHRKERISLVAKFLASRPFASPALATEKVLVQNRLREIEEKFYEISSARDNAWKALNVFLTLDSPIVPDAKWTNNPVLPNQDRLIAGFEERNPELRIQKSLIEKASLEAEQAGKKKYPDIRLGAGYNDQTVDQTQKTYTGLLELSLPIVDRGEYGKRAALAEKDAASYRLEQKRRELRSQFEQNWTTLLESKKRIELYPLSLVSSLETQMDRTEQGWKKGLVPITSYLELENQVHEQVFKVFDAQSEYVQVAADVKFLAGVESESEGK